MALVIYTGPADARLIGSAELQALGIFAGINDLTFVRGQYQDIPDAIAYALASRLTDFQLSSEDQAKFEREQEAARLESLKAYEEAAARDAEAASSESDSPEQAEVLFD